MKALRNHWFDFGLLLAVLLAIALWRFQPDGMDLLLWLSLGSLFLHQGEEYRFPGKFPGMVNKVMFHSTQPERFPLNTNSALLINVVLGWGSYFLAALFWKEAPWLAIATICVSAGNIFAHAILFNIKGKTLYNPGLLTALLLFLPIVVIFFNWVLTGHLASASDWILGIALGVCLNYFGIFKVIEWMANPNTTFIFPRRCL